MTRTRMFLLMVGATWLVGATWACTSWFESNLDIKPDAGQKPDGTSPDAAADTGGPDALADGADGGNVTDGGPDADAEHDATTDAHDARADSEADAADADAAD